MLEDVAADVVADRLAIGDGVFQMGVAALFDFEVALQAFRDIFSDQQLVEVLQIGQAFKKKDAFDQ